MQEAEMSNMKSSIKLFFKNNSLITDFARRVKIIFFPGSALYWEERYRKNGNSGAGSYGSYAIYKAGIINDFIKNHNISEAIEFGCGDGNQLQLLEMEKYTGIDVAESALKICRELYKQDTTKKFLLYDQFLQQQQIAATKYELCLSLDVIYHLVEENVYQNYMKALFEASGKYVMIYAWDISSGNKVHVRHRKFSKWIEEHAPGFRLIGHIAGNNTFCDFFIYQKITG